MDTNDIRIELPYSKSLSNRWLVLNYLYPGVFVLRGLSQADDTQLLQALLTQLQSRRTNAFFCKNAGTAARFLMALLAFTSGEWTLSGDESLKRRPMTPLIETLRGMGCRITCTDHEGYLPVNIVGCMPRYKMAEIDPTSSSQYVSAMLLAGTQMPKGLTLNLTGRPASRPYIDMTCSVLNQAGIETSVSANRRVYRVMPRKTEPTVRHRPQVVEIERDWSSAAYFYAAAALVPGVRVRMAGLSLNSSCQGDKAVAEIFNQLGVATKEVRSPYHKNTHSVTIQCSGKYSSTLDYNFLDCPDLLPPVMTTCAALGIKGRLRGVKNLRFKESDRLNALCNELGKMGAKLSLTDNEIRLSPAPLHPVGTVDTYADHRIAMSFGIMGLRYPDIVINDPSVVSKSFPSFWEQLRRFQQGAVRTVKTIG